MGKDHLIVKDSINDFIASDFLARFIYSNQTFYQQ